ncbi:uncharacterized protein VP01_515g8 [Puccinia sorghi]|uniref:glutamate synthase (ferredoxin) n=1 Tax=Puccinia sorghi TaxID=27349 RepID=A0A0L6ULN5_9BASI|nr:uncharacterized protein VP01_515g8 [Puccinia sorghi]
MKSRPRRTFRGTILPRRTFHGIILPRRTFHGIILLRRNAPRQPQRFRGKMLPGRIPPRQNCAAEEESFPQFCRGGILPSSSPEFGWPPALAPNRHDRLLSPSEPHHCACLSLGPTPPRPVTPTACPPHSVRPPTDFALSNIRMAQMLTTPSLTPSPPARNEELTRLFRGAIGANARDGNSAGVMTGIPHAFLLREASLLSIELPVQRRYAVGNFFFRPNPIKSLIEHKVTFERIALTHKLKVLGWRQVPRSNSILSPVTLSQEPIIFQPIMEPDFNHPDALFDKKEFELSPIGFTFDLYPTNSLPHPCPFSISFLLLLGKVNTVRGNKNWMRVCEGNLSHN